MCGTKVVWGESLFLLIVYLCCYELTFMCVFDDDRVTCHTRADDVPGDTGEA